LEKSVATAMQKFIVPWSIAIHCFSFTVNMKLDNIKEIMLIAIIDEQHLMPGFPNGAAEAKKQLVISLRR
jgi:hypothetical protein